VAISEKDQAIIDAVRDTDEPIIVFRAKDLFSASVIARYRDQAQKHGPSNPAWHEAITARLREFEQWQQDNVGRVKYPD
jgi:hypothetical protein